MESHIGEWEEKKILLLKKLSVSSRFRNVDRRAKGSRGREKNPGDAQKPRERIFLSSINSKFPIGDEITGGGIRGCFIEHGSNIIHPFLLRSI